MRPSFRARRLAFIVIALLLGTVEAQAQSVTLAWDRNPEANIAGYTVYVGVNPGTYSSTHDVNGVANTTFTFSNAVPGQRYYFSVAAYNTNNVTGSRSNEVSWKHNVGPNLTQPADQTGAVGSPASLQLTATDDGDPLTYSATGLPGGVTINSSSGLISGTPNAEGTFTVNVSVSDGPLNSGRTFTWTIGPRLTVTSLTSSVASPQIAGTAITFTATGSGGLTPYQFKYSVSTNGGSSYSVTRNWSTTATYTWTPTAMNANYRVKVDARNAGVTQDISQATANVPFNITPAPPPTADSVTPNSGTGESQTFAFRFSDSLGATNLATAWVWFTPTFSTAPSAFTNTCFLYYQRNTNTLYLLDNAGSAYASRTVGASGSIQNGQCSISTASSSASVSGNTLTLNLPMTFTGSFSGAKNIYMDAVSGAGATSGWPDRGDWTVPAGSTPAVAAVSSTPNTGTGASQTFALQYSDTAGATDLATTWVWFTPSNGSGMWVNSCFIYYQRATNTLNLLNDSGSTYASGTLGSGGTVANSQCSVALGSSSAAASGTTLTMNLAMTFTGTFSGAKSIYMDAVSNGGLTSGWPDRGDWTVPAGSGPAVSAVSVSPNTGTGASQTFALSYSDSLGATDLATTWAWFTPTWSTAPGAFTNTCFLYYQRNTHTLYLLNNAGTAYASGPVGSAGTLSNGQCSISLVSSSVSVSGTTLTMNLPMTFTGAFAGAKNVYMDAVSSSGLSSGWPDRGDWTVPGGSSGVQAVSASPNTGSGLTRSFTLTYSSSQGAADLATAWVWFAPTWSTAPGAFQNTCFVYYQRSNHTLYLLNDAGNAYVTRQIGAGGTIANSQCSIAVGSSQVVFSGNNLALTLAMTFRSPAFTGTKNIYMDAVSNGGVSSGWPDRGDWTVP